MKWSEIDLTKVGTSVFKGLPRFSGLKFQIPRGVSQYGLGAFKSIDVEVADAEFLDWWRAVETTFANGFEPFKSNLKGCKLRLKVDDDTYVFDERRNLMTPDLKEGLWRGAQMSCLVEISGIYFFNSEHGFVCRCRQIMIYDEASEESADEETVSCDLPRRALLDED